MTVKDVNTGRLLSAVTCNEQEARYFAVHLSYILEFCNETDFIEITPQTDLPGMRCTLISWAKIKSPLSVLQVSVRRVLTLWRWRAWWDGKNFKIKTCVFLYRCCLTENCLLSVFLKLEIFSTCPSNLSKNLKHLQMDEIQTLWYILYNHSLSTYFLDVRRP